MRFFATTAKGMEELLAGELRALGATGIDVHRAGVAFDGALATAYRACLWSRIASRVLLPLASFDAPTPAALYDGVRSIAWADHIGARRTLAVDCSVSRSQLAHSHYAALKTKDAIVDQLRERRGARPDVDVARPDVRVNVYVHADRATVSIDLSGESLHRRGYRAAGAAAPLKENLAAAVLLLAEWPRLAAAGVPLIDPMCGSGTIPIEAALIAAGIAPGLRRTAFGFAGWQGHQRAVWERLHREAEDRAIRDPKRLPAIRGSDADARAVRIAGDNARRAGVQLFARFERRPLAECVPIPSRGRMVPTESVAAAFRPPRRCARTADAPGASWRPEGRRYTDTASDQDRPPPLGLLVMNPPYGERLGDARSLEPLYAQVGDVLRRAFMGWTGYVLTGNPALAKRIGLRPARRVALYNGAIECRLLEFPISTAPVQREGPRWRRP